MLKLLETVKLHVRFELEDMIHSLKSLRGMTMRTPWPKGSVVAICLARESPALLNPIDRGVLGFIEPHQFPSGRDVLGCS